MDDKMVDLIQKYKSFIYDEQYDHIIEEMLVDLKTELINMSNENNIKYILETFHNIKKSDDIINELNVLENKLNSEVLTEGLVSGIAKTLGKIKLGFGNKHEKIVKRDKKWLDKNKKQILSLDYEQIELEVLSDYKVTFEQLLNRHNIFDKIFVNSKNIKNLDSLLNRFADKKDNLKNGLDNYFRTGTSRKEIGLRKVSGSDAKVAVENMVAYCESFLSGKKFIEEKLNKIVVDLNDSGIKEAYKILEASEDDDDFEDDEFDDNIDDEKQPNEEPKENKRSIRDRQTGIAVLLTVAEERYFDYMNILKGLSK